MKTKRILQHPLTIACLLTPALFLSSCSTVYIPNSQNIPLFQEKNQAAASVGLAMGDQSTGLDLQAAYAVTDHIAVMGNAYFGSVVEDWVSSADTTGTIIAEGQNIPYRNFEFGVGYFTKLGSSNGIFEVYGGWGIGGPQNTVDPIREFYRNNHFFLQPNIGGRLGAVDLAFSTRLNYVLWPEFSEVLVEPGLTLRFGWEKVKFQMQGVLSFPLDGAYNEIVYDLGDSFPGYEVFHTSFSVFVPLDFN